MITILLYISARSRATGPNLPSLSRGKGYFHSAQTKIRLKNRKPPKHNLWRILGETANAPGCPQRCDTSRAATMVGGLRRPCPMPASDIQANMPTDLENKGEPGDFQAMDWWFESTRRRQFVFISPKPAPHAATRTRAFAIQCHPTTGGTSVRFSTSHPAFMWTMPEDTAVTATLAKTMKSCSPLHAHPLVRVVRRGQHRATAQCTLKRMFMRRAMGA